MLQRGHGNECAEVLLPAMMCMFGMLVVMGEVELDCTYSSPSSEDRACVSFVVTDYGSMSVLKT